MPQIQEVWNKFNPRERLTAMGALAVAVGWIISLAGSFGLGGNTIALVGAIVVLVILFLKYSPNQSITWPAPVPLIILGISGIVALLLLGLINFPAPGLAGGFRGFFGAAIIAAIVTAVGAGIMVWGAWQEYQLTAGKTPGAAGPAIAAAAPSAWTPPPATAAAAPAQTMRRPASDTDGSLRRDPADIPMDRAERPPARFPQDFQRLKSSYRADLLAHERDVGGGEADDRQGDERDDLRPDEQQALVERQERRNLLLGLLDLADRGRSADLGDRRVEQDDRDLAIEGARQQPRDELLELKAPQDRVRAGAGGRCQQAADQGRDQLAEHRHEEPHAEADQRRRGRPAGRRPTGAARTPARGRRTGRSRSAS